MHTAIFNIVPAKFECKNSGQVWENSIQIILIFLLKSDFYITHLLVYPVNVLVFFDGFDSLR